MSTDIDIIPSVPHVPTIREFARELMHVIGYVYESSEVRAAFGDVPVSALRFRAQIQGFPLSASGTELRSVEADPDIALSFPDGVCAWISVDENSAFPLYFDGHSEDEPMSHVEVVEMVQEDAPHAFHVDPLLRSFPWDAAKEVGWHWSIWTRASRLRAMRMLGELSAMALGRLVQGVLYSGNHGIPPSHDPCTPEVLIELYRDCRRLEWAKDL